MRIIPINREHRTTMKSHLFLYSSRNVNKLECLDCIEVKEALIDHAPRGEHAEEGFLDELSSLVRRRRKITLIIYLSTVHDHRSNNSTAFENCPSIHVHTHMHTDEQIIYTSTFRFVQISTNQNVCVLFITSTRYGYQPTCFRQ